MVELGPGTGSTTQIMLQTLPKHGRLLAIEIDPEFASLLQSDPDPKLIVHQGSAVNIREAITAHGLPQADAVISGIPFSTMSNDLGKRIFNAVWSSLAPGGCFVAYQFTGTVAKIGRELIGPPEAEVALLNIPPLRLYSWRKPAR